MGHQVIKQSNGKYGLFSSVSGGLDIWDASKEEIIEYLIEQSKKGIIQQMEEIFKKVDSDHKAYYQFTKTWREAVAIHNKNFPKEKIPA